MSELQIGLLVVGAVVVAAVFLYNKWQERRYRREAEAGFASQREDVLMRSGGGAGQGTAPGLERLEPLVLDRRGAADEEELDAFGAAIERAAASVGALATVPDPASALANARELDRFCGEIDIRVAVHIISDAAPLTGTQLAALAKAAGFRLGEPDGKFRLPDEAGRIICALANFEPTPLNIDGLSALSTRGVTLELDVPRAPYGAFTRFRQSAQMLARELKARIVDDNREPVGPAAFDAIGAQLQAVHGSMEARGIAPGGALALRLFS